MKRSHQAAHENHERWLVSYADFITLLFAFFVVMFASTQADKDKAKQVSEAVREALEHGQFSSTLAMVLGRGRHEASRPPTNPERVNLSENLPPAIPQVRPADLSKSFQSLANELASEVLRGGLDTAAQAACPVAGGHSVDDPEPKYGMAVTGLAAADRLLRNDAGRAGLPLSLTKPLGLGVLNNRHKQTGDVFPHAVSTMTELNAAASLAALAAGSRCATDVTGFGLLGHLYKLARASGVTAVIDAAAVPYLDGARQSARDGFISGGTRRNLAWVQPHTAFAATVGEIEQLLLADAQTSGGLLVAGEIPGAPIIGELVARRDAVIEVR